MQLSILLWLRVIVADHDDNNALHQEITFSEAAASEKVPWSNVSSKAEWVGDRKGKDDSTFECESARANLNEHVPYYVTLGCTFRAEPLLSAMLILLPTFTDKEILWGIKPKIE